MMKKNDLWDKMIWVEQIFLQLRSSGIFDDCVNKDIHSLSKSNNILTLFDIVCVNYENKTFNFFQLRGTELYYYIPLSKQYELWLDKQSLNDCIVLETNDVLSMDFDIQIKNQLLFYINELKDLRNLTLAMLKFKDLNEI